MTLQRFLGLVSRTYVIATITVIVCACFVARMVGSLIAAEALAEAPASSAVPAKIAAAPKPARTKLDGTKIDRNIFCSSCEPAAVVAGAPSQYTGEPAVLIATMLGPDPRATVRVIASEAQGSWGIGERIPGVGLVDRIGATSIDVVDVAGHRGTISLLDASSGEPPARVGAATPNPVAPADPYADVVRKIAEGDYEVDRQFVRDLVSSGAKPGYPRLMPQMKDGNMTVRLSGVRPGSIATAVGMRNGDVITTINGEPMKNAQQILDLYAKLDQLSTVELGGTRAGKPLTLVLRLR